MNSHDPLLDHRARIERAQLEAGERRSQALLDQKRPDSSHEERVRVWERLHHVCLPRNPEHAVLRFVARQTGLALSEVLAVQRARSQSSASAT